MDETQQDWNHLIAPTRPPTHATLGAGFLIFRAVEIAAIGMLTFRPGLTITYALAAAALISIAVNTARWRGQHATRVADVHRWAALRTILKGDLLDAVSVNAAQYTVDERAIFTLGVQAAQDHIQRVVHVENSQASAKIGWM